MREGCSGDSFNVQNNDLIRLNGLEVPTYNLLSIGMFWSISGPENMDLLLH